MNLLKAALYDPAVAVAKACTALLAMTAFDTTNLRLAITVPAHGMVRFKMMCTITGATTFPTVLLGVMNGATVIGRVAPAYFPGTANAASQDCTLVADFTVTGLAAGAMNVDAAYAVQVLLAATNIKYGGPNNTTGNNAWGAFVFEAWDPQPMTANSTLAVDANGRVDVSKVLGTAQTAGDLKASLNTLQADTDDIQTRLPAALVGGRMDSSTGAMAANVLTAAAINAAALNGKGDWSTYAGGDTAGTTTLLARLTAGRATNLDNLDATVSSRLATAGYTAPPSAAVVADAVWDELIAGHLGVGSTGLQLSLVAAGGLDAAGVRAAVGLASANLDTQLAEVPLIKAKTDSLVFTVAGKIDAGLYYVNGIAITGSGTDVAPWKAA